MSQSNYISENRERLGKSIKELREKKGYSQEQLADIMNISRSTISKIESGKFNMSVDYIAKFSRPLDFEIKIEGI